MQVGSLLAGWLAGWLAPLFSPTFCRRPAPGSRSRSTCPSWTRSRLPFALAPFFPTDWLFDGREDAPLISALEGAFHAPTVDAVVALVAETTSSPSRLVSEVPIQILFEFELKFEFLKLWKNRNELNFASSKGIYR